MLSLNSIKILKLLTHTDGRTLSTVEIARSSGLSSEAVLSACNHLVQTQCAVWNEPKQLSSRSVSLTEKGGNLAAFFFSKVVVFIGKSICTPIVVSILTTLITLWIKSIL